MAHPDRQEERIAALEAAVRELADRLDRIAPHLAVARDDDVAGVLDRYPDLRKHLPTLG